MLRPIAIIMAGLCVLMAACGGSSDAAPSAGGRISEVEATQVVAPVRGTASASSFGDTASARASSNSNSSASASSGSSKGSLALTGAISGTLNITTSACASAGSKNIALSGTLSGVAFGLNVNAPTSGDFTYGAGVQQGTVPTAQFTDQSPAGSGKTWSAGFQQAPGSGTITVSADGSGSIDADLTAPSAANGTVHVRGSWKC